MHIVDILEFFQLPHIRINLMYEKTHSNDSFYAEAVKRFYSEAMARHPKLPFAKQYQYGYAVCPLPSNFDTYFKNLDSSARNNYRKAVREGYEFRRFDYNAHLEDIRQIWKSCTIRQGKLPTQITEGHVVPVDNPPSRTPYQDYPYFGVFKHGHLVAYAACLVSGELCSFHDLYGHAHHLEKGVVPMAIIEIARDLLATYPHVRYYGYGTYFGASESLRRFKRKFLFLPHRVTWLLRTPTHVTPASLLAWTARKTSDFIRKESHDYSSL